MQLRIFGTVSVDVCQANLCAPVSCVRVWVCYSS